MALVKCLIPWISMAITSCESWDFASTRIKNEIWKLFLAYILNVVTICIISIEFVMRKSYFRDQAIMSGLAEYYCKEDQVGILFLKTSLIDYFAGILFTEIINWCRALLGLEIPVFSASEEAVSLLYFQALLWCTLLFYPYLALIIPILLYIRFKYTGYVLSCHRKAPAETSFSPVFF